jgi:RNA polymerase sigma-70 factor (sigma-E family)
MRRLVRKRYVHDDQAAFVEFYEANRDSCMRALVVSIGDPELAEELVADAFARAWASWSKVRRHPAPRAWVLRTAMNAGVSRWRKRRSESSLLDHDLAAPEAQSDSVDQELMDALRNLSARQREVVALRIVLDLDTETTARVLGIASGTVTAHLSRAVATLRNRLVAQNAMEVER